MDQTTFLRLIDVQPGVFGAVSNRGLYRITFCDDRTLVYSVAVRRSDLADMGQRADPNTQRPAYSNSQYGQTFPSNNPMMLPPPVPNTGYQWAPRVGAANTSAAHYNSQYAQFQPPPQVHHIPGPQQYLPLAAPDMQMLDYAAAALGHRQTPFSTTIGDPIFDVPRPRATKRKPAAADEKATTPSVPPTAADPALPPQDSQQPSGAQALPSIEASRHPNHPNTAKIPQPTVGEDATLTHSQSSSPTIQQRRHLKRMRNRAHTHRPAKRTCTAPSASRNPVAKSTSVLPSTLAAETEGQAYVHDYEHRRGGGVEAAGDGEEQSGVRSDGDEDGVEGGEERS